MALLQRLGGLGSKSHSLVGESDSVVEESHSVVGGRSTFHRPRSVLDCFLGVGTNPLEDPTWLCPSVKITSRGFHERNACANEVRSFRWAPRLFFQKDFFELTITSASNTYPASAPRKFGSACLADGPGTRVVSFVVRPPAKVTPCENHLTRFQAEWKRHQHCGTPRGSGVAPTDTDTPRRTGLTDFLIDFSCFHLNSWSLARTWSRRFLTL